MVTRQIVLVVLGVTLFGVLGSLIATLVMPVRYQAKAYVVVYDMPRGLNDVLSPDEAANLDDVYRAGVLQDAVLQKVQAELPGYSAEDIARAIQVEIIAYTPLTRITASATTAELATRLANDVAAAWTAVAGAANEKAYNATQATLEARESDLLQKMATIQQALKAAKPTSASATQLQAELRSLQSDLNKTGAAILNLDIARYDVVGNAYVQVFAKASEATRTPDPVKNVAVGLGTGFSLGLLLALWLVLRRWKRDEAYGARRPAASMTVSVGGG